MLCAKNFIRRLSRSICSHFVAVYSWNVRRSRKLKTSKSFTLEVQVHLRSPVLTPLKSSSLVLVMISIMSVPIC